MTRKTTDDQAARDAAVEIMRQATGLDAPLHVQKDGVAAFEAAQFETTTAKVGGQPLELRRVVLTGPWEPVRK
jgi:hypothetical protein